MIERVLWIGILLILLVVVLGRWLLGNNVCELKLPFPGCCDAVWPPVDGEPAGYWRSRLLNERLDDRGQREAISSLRAIRAREAAGHAFSCGLFPSHRVLAKEALEEALEHKDPRVRLQVVKWADLEPDKALSTLVELLDALDPALRDEVVQAFTLYGDRGKALLQLELDERGRSSRR